MTSVHVKNCISNPNIQKSWEPSKDDWYFCVSDSRFHQINNLEEYQSSKPGVYEACHAPHGYCKGKWPCDFYISKPDSD